MIPTSNPALRFIRRLAVPADVRDLPDPELLSRFRAGRDEAAFTALVVRHGPMVLGVCRRTLGDEHASDDVFQAAFLALAQHAASLREPPSVGSWLYGVAFRLALKAKRGAARRRTHEVRTDVTLAQDPLADVTVREAQAILDEELARLPEELRAPLLLCCLQGLTRDEAAQQLGWPVRALKSRLEQARERLRRRLARRGLTLPAALAAVTFVGGVAGAAPKALVISTVQTVVAAMADRAVGDLLSGRATTFTKGVQKTMLLTKLKIATGVLLVAVVVAAVGLVGLPVLSGEPTQSTWTEKPTARDADQSKPTTGAQGPKKDKDADKKIDKAEPPPPTFAVRAAADDLLSPVIVTRLGALPAELVKAKKCDAEIVEALYLAVLLRLPSEKERQTATAQLQGAKDREERVRDVAWALLNTKEFLKLHRLDKDVAGSLKILQAISAAWEKK